MKYSTGFLCVMVLVFGVVGLANATLHDRGAGLIYDDVLDITWVQDANHAGGNMTWSNSTTWAANLVYSGYSDWRIPTSDKNGDGRVVGYHDPYTTEEACRDNEYAYMYRYNLGGSGESLTGNQTSGAVTLYNIQPICWSSSWFNGLAVGFFFTIGHGDANHSTYLRSPWAVRNGDSEAAVPTQSTTWGLIKALYE
jgi:hypothetical protein